MPDCRHVARRSGNGVFARLGNDRLLLGLKGTLNEYELDLLRQRASEARVEKARRGELVSHCPVGFVKDEDGRLQKEPDERIRRTIELVFAKFIEISWRRFACCRASIATR